MYGVFVIVGLSLWVVASGTMLLPFFEKAKILPLDVVLSCLQLNYHLTENDYSFDALQFDCFRIKIKL